MRLYFATQRISRPRACVEIDLAHVVFGCKIVALRAFTAERDDELRPETQRGIGALRIGADPAGDERCDIRAFERRQLVLHGDSKRT
jgi:hypothetical protein